LLEKPGTAEVVIIKRGYMTKSDLARIYHMCGEKLHAGSLKALMKKGRPRYDLEEIEQAFNSIVKLLSHHIIRLPEMKATMLVAMAQEPDGHVHCAMSELVDEGPLHFVAPPGRPQ